MFIKISSYKYCYFKKFYRKIMNYISKFYDKKNENEIETFREYSRIVFDDFNRNTRIKNMTFEKFNNNEHERSIIAASIIFDFANNEFIFDVFNIDFIISKKIWNEIINYLAYEFNTSYECILISICLIGVENTKNIKNIEDIEEIFKGINYEELHSLEQIIYDFCINNKNDLE